MTRDLVLAHWKMELYQIVRAPGYVIQLFGFPILFFFFFGVPEAGEVNEANRIMVSYALYAMLGAVLNQVVGSIAEDRREIWYPYLNTLPMFQRARLLGRTAVAFGSGVAAAVFVVIVSMLVTPVSLDLFDWLFLALAIFLGFAPLLALGLAIGYAISPRTAPLVTSIIYFSLAYGGSLWTSPSSLPNWLQEVSWLLPTRMWAEVAWAATFDYEWATLYWAGLLAYGAVFAVAAYLAARRPIPVRHF